ncbi:MAG: amino acid adenylation domain-containing protein, partial [Cellulosilyticaceae bacterium]
MKQRLDKSNVAQILPLTSLQNGMLFHYLEQPDSLQYVEQLTITLQGILDLEAITKAWEHVSCTNEVLRAVFRWEKLDKPVMIVLKEKALPILFKDLSEATDPAQSLQAFTYEDQQQGIDLLEDPIRITICKLSEEVFAMVVTNHHMLYDGWSNGILMKEFIEAYNCCIEAKPFPSCSKNSFGQFAQWHKAYQENEHLSYWEKYLEGLESRTVFPPKRKANASIRPSRYKCVIEDDLAQAIDAFNKERKLTLSTLLYTAWGIVLGKYSYDWDVLFGTTVSGRNVKVRGIEEMVGLFINTLPVRVQLQPEMLISEQLKEVQQQLVAREDHEQSTLADIQSKVKGVVGEDLFRTLLVVENYPMEQEIEKLSRHLKVRGVDTFEMTHYALTVVVECLQNLSISFLYDDENLTEAQIKRLGRHMVNVIRAIISAPDQKVSELTMLDADETEALKAFNPPATPYEAEKTLPQIFEEQVAQREDAIAVQYGEATLSYKALNERANQLAHFLTKEGVNVQTPVGLLCERSVEMIVAIWGVLKAGGTYVPIDPEYPKTRIDDIIEDSGLKFMLTHCQKEVMQFEGCMTLELTTLEEQLQKEPTHNPVNGASADDLAYIMYTSGSTGKPKGTLISHANISRVVRYTNYITIQKEDVLLQLSNYSFDGSTFDLFGAFLNGAKLVLVGSHQLLDAVALGQLIQEEQVTVFFITTALFNNLMDEVPEALKHVRCVLTGGERMSTEHAKKFYKLYGDGKLMNVYGPTESTVFATCHKLEDLAEEMEAIPIGKPIANTTIYILDKAGKLAPLGAVGELCIGGQGIGKGYLNNEALTQEKFISNPFDASGKLYRTGDLAKWNEQGEVNYEERIDQQIKLRGYRIELGEIEKALSKVEGLKQGVVQVIGDATNERYICGYVVGEGEVSSIKAQLKAYLPYYMIPQQFVFMEQLPLNKNGKVDKKALPLPELQTQETVYIPPSNATETKLQAIWQEVLAYEPIGVNDSFYEVGGHSLKATRIVAKIHKAFDVKLPLATFFECMTIKALADYIDHAACEVYEPMQAVATQEDYPLATAQRTVFLQEQFEGIGTSYHIPIALQVKEQLDFERVQGAFQELIHSHEVLRTAFVMKEQPVQKILPDVPVNVERVVCKPDEVQSILKQFVRRFDLAKPPLMRMLYMEVSGASNILAMDCHHMIADGIAITHLVEDFFKLYQKKTLAIPSIQYKDYVLWQAQELESEGMAKQKAFWQKMYESGIPTVDFVTDYPRKSQPSFEGGHQVFKLAAPLVEKLESVCKVHHVTMNAVLFAAYGLLLQKYAREETMVIGSLVAGRTHPDVEDMVGMFNNYLPILMEVPTSERCDTYLKKVNQQLSKCYAHQGYPYDLMIQDLQVRQSASRNPFFDTMLIYHNQLEKGQLDEVEGIGVEMLELENTTAKLDFKVDIYHSHDGMNCIFEYATALYKPSTIARMGSHYIKLLEEMVQRTSDTLGAIAMLTEEEAFMLLNTFNDTQVPYSTEKTLVHMFEEQVQKTPTRIAVSYEDEQLTFEALGEKVHKLACYLRDSGVEDEQIVGVCMERSLEMIIAILAILKAGGAYMPMSPEYPEERITYMMQDSGAKLILCQERFQRQREGIRCINVEDGSLYKGPSQALNKVYRPSQLAYVIYTSGSTGQPKGVMIEHGSVINRIQWMQKKYPIGEADCILQKTPYTFDVSVWELFWWLFTGARVHFLKPQGEKDPSEILQAIQKHHITTMHFVPSMLAVFLEYYETSQEKYDLSSLRQVFASGEALTVAQVKKFNQLIHRPYHTTLHNLYGPTEATVDVSYYDCPVEGAIRKIPIGKPIDNTRLYVLDEAKRLQPIGVPGELYISGVGVGRGYLNKPALTEEKFMEDPHYAGYRMYRSGDLTRWMEDGNIEYLGRMDHQVKLRGLRIELGEIEVLMDAYEGVLESVVVVKEDARGNQHLCGYYTANKTIEVSALRNHISQKLPHYMIPSFFVQLESMPLSANGKLDRKRLPEVDFKSALNETYVEPTTAIEKELAAIWLKLLNVDQVGVTHQFFELGGHSLIAAKLTAEIQSAFGIQMTLNKVFEKPTIKEQALYIEEAARHMQEKIVKADKRPYYPLAQAQER